MRPLAVVFFIFFTWGCKQPGRDSITVQPGAAPSKPGESYKEIKDSIANYRKQFAAKYSKSLPRSIAANEALNEFWISSISNTLFTKWENTPWDFNGITTTPKQGAIACGYFVTTILRDMDCKINRTKLAICPSSVMMRTLAPRQKLMNLSSLAYVDFNDALKDLGKGVYIIGLDFHTGFIVNDGRDNWFIHSNYIRREGVIKERVLNSGALRSSKTRWLISLTRDKVFMQKWLKG